MAVFELGADALDSGGDLVFGGGVVGGGEEENLGELLKCVAGQGVNEFEFFDLVEGELDTDGVLTTGRININGVALDAEGTALEVNVVSVVEDVGEEAGQPLDRVGIANFEQERHVLVVAGVADAVDTGDAGDDNDVLAGE